MAKTELVKTHELDKMLGILFADTPLEVVSSEQIQLEMVRRIMQAETMEEAFAEFKSTPMEHVEDVPLHVTGIAWAKSTYEEGAPIFALIRCHVHGDNREMVVSCGGTTVITRLRWAELHEAMPFDVRFVREQSQQNPEYKFWTAKLA
jgi:hypothetical protein